MVNKLTHATHTFPPVYDDNSRVLILGSFPSVKSRESEFFYMHPQNRFWKVLSSVYNDDFLGSIEDKKAKLLKHNIALYDVIESCDIIGSSDSSIKHIEKADIIIKIIKASKIKKIVLNGKMATNLFCKYFSINNVQILSLPSTSSANAAFTLGKLIDEWSIILNK